MASNTRLPGAAEDGDVEHSEAVACLHSAIVEERGQPLVHCGEIFEATALHIDARRVRKCDGRLRFHLGRREDQAAANSSQKLSLSLTPL